MRIAFPEIRYLLHLADSQIKDLFAYTLFPQSGPCAPSENILAQDPAEYIPLFPGCTDDGTSFGIMVLDSSSGICVRIILVHKPRNGAGFDESAAEKAAQAFTAGDIESLSAALAGYKSSIETGLKAKLMDDTPRPEGGGKADATPDYTKLYEEAVKAGNMPEAASYIRLAQQQKQ